MYFLYDNRIYESDSLEIKVLSPFLHTSQILTIKLLYDSGKIYFFNALTSRLIEAAQRLNLSIGGELPDKDQILALISENSLTSNHVLIKILCIEQSDGCHFITLSTQYHSQVEPVTCALHAEPQTSSLRKLPLQLPEDFIIRERYAELYNAWDALLINYKKQFISATQGSLIAIWNKNLYFVHRTQPYYEPWIQHKLIKLAPKLGIKKVLDKNKGFAEKFVWRVDELLIINDWLDIRPIKGYFNQNGKYFELSTTTWAEKIRTFFHELPELDSTI